jgi:hypothetical protein
VVHEQLQCKALITKTTHPDPKIPSGFLVEMITT